MPIISRDICRGIFTHTERIAIVDSHGQVQAYFDGLNDDVATAVVAELNRLRQPNVHETHDR